MTEAQTFAIFDAVRASLTGERTFPEIVASLAAVGVERYHVDYARHEKTFYLGDSDSLVVSSPWASHPTADAFSAPAVEAAVRQSQRGEHTYKEFLRKTMAVGCVGYFVQIRGRRALYFGRDGEVHVERFPDAKPAST